MSNLINVYRDRTHYCELYQSSMSDRINDWYMYCDCIDDIQQTYFLANSLYEHIEGKYILHPDTVKKYLDDLRYRDSRLKFILSFSY